MNLSLNPTVLKFLLCVRQTWVTQLILAISVRGYLPLIRKDPSTHMHGLAVYVKEGFPFAQDLSLENSADFYLLSTGFTSPSVLLIFALLITFFSFVHGF